VTTAVAPAATELTAADRCDRCGAQAYLRVELQTGGELLFCAHHAREHGEKIKEIAVNVVDETHKLEKAPASAPIEER
jgi:4-hydroxyphenylpyruvate dioxygenase-like putative hemolysin